MTREARGQLLAERLGMSPAECIIHLLDKTTATSLKPPAPDDSSSSGKAKEDPAEALYEAREQMQKVDEQILTLLVRRRRFSLQAAKAKDHMTHPVEDVGQEEEKKSKLRALARAEEYPQADIVSVYETVAECSKRAQLREIES